MELKKTQVKSNRQIFLEETMLSLKGNNFADLRGILLDQYLKLRFIDVEDVTPQILTEKVYDHFDKIVQKTGQSFGQQSMEYIDKITYVLSGYIFNENEADSRAYKYYQKAKEIKEKNEITTEDMIRFSRIMFCLYAEAKKGEAHRIVDFDYSVSAVHPIELLNALKNEKEKNHFGWVRQIFDLDYGYSTDNATMIIAAIMLFKITEDGMED